MPHAPRPQPPMRYPLRRSGLLLHALPVLLALASSERDSEESEEPATSPPDPSPVRSKMREWIRDEPGISQDELRKRAEVGGGAFYYHLEHLKRNGEIVIRTLEGRLRVYPSDEAPEGDEPDGPLAHPTTKRIAQILIEEPGLSSSEIAERADVSLRTAQLHLAQLEEAKLAVATRIWRTVGYSATPRLKKLWKTLRE